MEDTLCMANQRKAGVERITLTLTDDLLRAAEAQASRQGVDRLVLVRDALKSYIGYKEPKAKPAAAKSGAKAAKKAKAAKPAKVTKVAAKKKVAKRKK